MRGRHSREQARATAATTGRKGGAGGGRRARRTSSSEAEEDADGDDAAAAEDTWVEAAPPSRKALVVPEDVARFNPPDGRLPKMPMVMRANNLWYRSQIIEERPNRVCVSYCGLEHAFPNEWLDRKSSRLWKGSYKGPHWKHVGEGAWQPKVRLLIESAEQAAQRQARAQSKRRK